MPDERLTGRATNECVAAVAGILGPATALSDTMDAVTEEAAQIAHTLLEDAAIGIRVAIERKEQRMAASHAGVLRVTVTPHHRLVGVIDEKA